MLPEANDLVGSTSDRCPFELTAGTVFSTNDLCQRVAPAYPMQESECVADVALAAGICAYDDGEGTDAQCFVREVLEIYEAD